MGRYNTKKMPRRAVDAAADIPLSIAGFLSSILQMEKQVVNHYFSIHREHDGMIGLSRVGLSCVFQKGMLPHCFVNDF